MGNGKRGRPATSSNARKVFNQQSKRIEEMLDKHIDTQGRKRGRRPVLDPISRAAIVFICAAWQVYVEDVAKEVARYIVENTSDFAALDSSVQSRYLKTVENYCCGARSSRKPYGELKDENQISADKLEAFHRLNRVNEDTWQDFFCELLDMDIEKINTPNSANIIDFFKGWFSLSGKDFQDRENHGFDLKAIDRILGDRHRIAHGSDIRDLTGVESSRAKKALDDINTIVKEFDAFLGWSLNKRYDDSPWGYYEQLC